MKLVINFVLRALCLLVFVVAAARLAGLLPKDLFDRAPLVAAVLLALHAAELVVMLKHVRLYKGSLAVSVVLTMLFGLLHWKPLADEEQARASKRA